LRLEGQFPERRLVGTWPDPVAEAFPKTARATPSQLDLYPSLATRALYFVRDPRFVLSFKRRGSMTNVNVNVTTKCEECGATTDESFTYGFKLHYFCPKHEDVVFAKVTGKPPKPSSDGKK
jgi:hypothetical protein